MKTNLKFTVLTFLLFSITSCNDQSSKVDVLNNEFPEAQQEIMETYEEIIQSIKEGNIDKLISMHAYGPKFTEFKNGELRNGSKENEIYERKTFSAVTEVVKFDSNNLQIAVYGDVANVTFHSDFEFKFGEDLVVVHDQISLLFLNTLKGWKIVAEHHSPLKK